MAECASRTSARDHNKSAIARKRWKILGKALAEQKASAVDFDVSVRRFKSFGLLSSKELEIEHETKSMWYEYSCSHLPVTVKAKVRILTEYYHLGTIRAGNLILHLSGTVSATDLIGFNNTGNLCVWPSEEVLAYYCLKQASMFNGKRVCEIGGGMTCLAGLFVALASNATEVLLTDGNLLSVNNVKMTMEENKPYFNHTKVSCRVLRWDLPQDTQDLAGAFDFILCADCVFFHEEREELVQTLMKILKPMGEVIILAPMRSNTLNEFHDIALKHCDVQRVDNYDPVVWDLHTKFKHDSCGISDLYSDDLHYPIMLLLRKKDMSEVLKKK